MKKNKFNLPLVLCAVFVAVLSCFACFKVDNYSSVNAESVDTNYYFHANDNYYIGVYDFSGTAANQRFILFNGDIQSNNNNISTRLISYITLYTGLGLSYDIVDNIQLYTKSPFANVSNGTSTSWFNLGFNTPYRFTMRYSVSGAIYDFYIFTYIDDGFNANVYKADLFLSTTNAWETSPRGDGLKFFNIRYYDVNNNTFTFSFLVSSNYWFNDRTYYFVGASDLSDNQIYNQGFQDGIRDNQQNIYNDGYQNGLTVGYNNGRADGIEDSNVYTFSNLLSSVIDTPITYFRSLFNFELLGVNLTDFFLGLFTLCVIITIVKMCLGR